MTTVSAFLQCLRLYLAPPELAAFKTLPVIGAFSQLLFNPKHFFRRSGLVSEICPFGGKWKLKASSLEFFVEIRHGHSDDIVKLTNIETSLKTPRVARFFLLHVTE
jgi:hypothetical protein